MDSPHNGPAGIISCMCQANERWHYNVMTSLIGWAHSQNDPWTSNAELSYFLWCSPEQAIGQTVELPVIWDTMISMWCYCFDELNFAHIIKIFACCAFTKQTDGFSTQKSSNTVRILKGLNPHVTYPSPLLSLMFSYLYTNYIILISSEQCTPPLVLMWSRCRVTYCILGTE